MPVDNYEEDDSSSKKGKDDDSSKRQFDEFECPGCNANNPCEKFGDGDEVLCNYCGSSFIAKVSDEGRLKLKEN